MTSATATPGDSASARLPGKAATWAPAAAAAVVGILLSCLAFAVVRAGDDVRVAGTLQLRAEWRARDFEAKIEAATQPVRSLATFIASIDTVDADGFARLAGWAQVPGDPIRSLIWAPRVADGHRAAFVAQARSAIAPDFAFRKLDPGRGLVPSERRDEYFPVALERRFEGQASVLGFDLLSEPERRLAAERARDEARAIATPPMALVRDPSTDLQMQVFWPVYDGAGSPNDLAKRRAALRGFAVGAFRINAMLAAAIRGTPDIVETIDFFVADAAGKLQAVAQYDPATRRFGISTPAAAEDADAIVRRFDMLGRQWVLVSHFAPPMAAALRSSGPQVTLLAGLLLTLMVAAYFYREGNRRHALEVIADQRTIDLEAANLALQAEAAQRQQAQQQLVQAVKMEAIGNLTGGIAHDFNNLLGVIIGNLDLLRELKVAEPEVEELAREALDAAMRGTELTRGLLAFARRQPLRPQLVDVNELVSDITKLMRRALGERVEIDLDLADGVWPVTADPAQLEAALANLATNACDAMPKGGRLMIATGNRPLDRDYAAQHPEVVPGDYVAIEVSDTGTGIPPELISRIFEPFFTTKDQRRGSGLGLAMVFGYMKQSGGHVSVYSELGVGTTFRLYLPRAGGADDLHQADHDEQPCAGRGETVLLVEDDVALRRAALCQLTELGYAVQEAENARAALARFERDPAIDVLFANLVMPGDMDGLELAQIAMTRWPHVKIVLTSGFPGTKITEDSDIRMLGKPYRKEELARALRDVLDGESALAGDDRSRGDSDGNAADH